MALIRRKTTRHRSRLPALAGGIATAVLAGSLLTTPASAEPTAGGPTNLRMSPVPVNGSTGTCGYLHGINSLSTLDLFATVGEANGPLVGAHFELHEVGNGDPTTFDSGWVSQQYGIHEAQTRIPGDLLTDGKTYAWSVESGLANAPGSDRTTGCAFTYDGTAAAPPTVTSTDFPVDGGGKYAGQAGVFVFGTGTDTDVTAIEYALNGSVPVGGAARALYDAPSGTWHTPPLIIGRWGTNYLYAQTIDRAGNRSRQTIHSFFAPTDPNPPAPKPGDINRDGKVDILSVDAAGALRFHSAGDDPAAGGRIAAAAKAGPGQRTWAGALVTHRGGDSADYLYAYANGAMRAYRSVPGPLPEDGFFSTRVSVVTRPQTCVDPTAADGTCIGYAGSWSRVTQLVAAGDVDGVATGSSAASTRDLFTIEDDGAGNARLWLFVGTVGTGFDHAIPIGLATRQNQDIMVPGDVTGDGLPELWIRDRTNGNVYQYASVKKADGTADLDAYTATPTLIGTGFDTTAHPQVSTDGDFDGDGKADLWARTPNGNIYTFPGQAPDATGNTFGPAQLIAGT
ncbi:FG-GAP repeat domain-containing protein [Embleya sp. NPDC056575]|uniref:FG-GAP repeat domain-containing protein n=1 Tax=unclassified Embleya TaxID=2699296 RepID=UPI00368C065F